MCSQSLCTVAYCSIMARFSVFSASISKLYNCSCLVITYIVRMLCFRTYCVLYLFYFQIDIPNRYVTCVVMLR